MPYALGRNLKPSQHRRSAKTSEPKPAPWKLCCKRGWLQDGQWGSALGTAPPHLRQVTHVGPNCYEKGALPKFRVSMLRGLHIESGIAGRALGSRSWIACMFQAQCGLELRASGRCGLAGKPQAVRKP